MADILGSGDSGEGKGGLKTRKEIQEMAEKGIVGRGILLDYHGWWQRNSSSELPIDGFKTHHIRLEDLLATAKEQGTEIHFGDILLILSGYMVSLVTKSASEVVAQHTIELPTFIGMEQSKEALRWLWENFSAVAGDQQTFEGWPSLQEWRMHEVLLSGRGCPIGELFDLEKLAVYCEKEKRWSFFVTSEVCNVPGGVARYFFVLLIWDAVRTNGALAVHQIYWPSSKLLNKYLRVLSLSPSVCRHLALNLSLPNLLS